MDVKPLACLENIVPGLELYSFQNIGAQQALLNKRMLLAFDTGTGKTFTYSLIVRALLNNNPEKKHIFVIIHDSLEQAPKDIRNLVAAPVFAFSSAAGEFGKLRRRWEQLSVAVLTYECFRLPEVVLFLYERMGEIESIVIDEAHHAANWDGSDTAYMLRALCQYAPYLIELTATPMTSHSSQFYQLLNLVDRDLSPRRDETATGKYLARYMPVNRGDYDIKGNYKTTLVTVVPQPNQVGDIHGIISRVIKGTGATNQVEALLDVVKSRLLEEKKIIIYVNYHDTRQWVEHHLDQAAIGYVSLHGKITKMDERRSILNSFESGEAPILITSVSESLNIESDVVIFYEFTTKLKQVMGRAHRGLVGKELELVFVVTVDSTEVDYFMKYVYQRSLTIQKLLQKDYSEFIEIGEKLRDKGVDSDV